MDVKLIPAFHDNYLFLGYGKDGKSCFVVDPGAADPVLDFLLKQKLSLSTILTTHHHPDHIGGVRQLLEHTGCSRVVGPTYDLRRIPGVTEAVKDGDVVDVLGYEATVKYIPGHTSGHIAYYFESEKVLFCGDTLFSVGCGRMFEGNKEQMWDSLESLRCLPDDTRVYCAHEYTLSNIKFALSVDGDNKELHAYHERCQSLRSAGLPTIPTSIGIEKKVNPFLRVDNPAFIKSLGSQVSSPAALFGQLRAAKDVF